jgi:hypothetical protein
MRPQSRALQDGAFRLIPLLLSQESVSHSDADAVWRQAAVVLLHCSCRGVEGRRSGKRWPELPLIISTKNPATRQRILQRSARGIREIAPFQATRRRVIDRCDPATAQLHLEPAREPVIPKEPISGTSKIILFHLATGTVEIQPARFTFDAVLPVQIEV